MIGRQPKTYEKEVVFSFWTEEELRDVFKHNVIKRGLKIGYVLRKLLKGYVDGIFDINDVQEKK